MNLTVNTLIFNNFNSFFITPYLSIQQTLNPLFPATNIKMSDTKKIFKNLDDLERKVTKSNKIAQKGEKMGYGDAIKLGRKSNSITSTINKGVKEYDGVTPTDAEAKKILDQMTKVVELTEEQLNALVANKSRFDTLKVGGKY